MGDERARTRIDLRLQPSFHVVRVERLTKPLISVRQTFTLIETDERVTGVTPGGSADVKVAGAQIIGEDPLRVEYL